MLRPCSSRPTHRGWFLSIGLLLPAVLPQTISGQSPEGLVREFAETASGFTLVGEIRTGAANAGQEVILPLAMVTGSDYMMVGFCDQDCTDMDMVLLDSQGNEMDSDYLPDPQPILLVSPERSGGYRIRLDMVACRAEPCGYAVGVFQGQGGGAGFGLPGADMDDRLVALREDLMAEGYSEMGAGEAGSLEEGQEMRFPLALSEEVEYRVVGVCDDDCENMDLALFAPDGSEADSDRLADPFPIVDANPEATDEYRLAVSMVTCTLEPCAFRVAVFGRGPRVAPGGVLVTGEIISRTTHRGRLDPGDEQLREGEYFDEYTIRAEAGQRIMADLRSPHFDTFLILEAPSGDSERNDDYAEDTMHSHIEWEVEEDGDYAILVTSFSPEATGDYVLQVAVVEGS